MGCHGVWLRAKDEWEVERRKGGGSFYEGSMPLQDGRSRPSVWKMRTTETALLQIFSMIGAGGGETLLGTGKSEFFFVLFRTRRSVICRT